MISNKYRLIFIHPPKTGGTTISTMLHEDLEQECEVEFGEDGGINSIYPSSIDFPWWRVWVKYAQVLWAENKKLHGAEASAPLVGCDIYFCPGNESDEAGGGNIKHLSLTHWQRLFNGPRIKHYQSFHEEYNIVSSCRNPYEREFSWFIYDQTESLKEMAQGLSPEETRTLLRKQWLTWARGQAFGKAERPFSESRPQVDMFLPTFIPHLIRLEHIEEDYNAVCEKIGLVRKNTEAPHKLNFRKTWEEYLPDNILEWYTDEIRELIHTHRADDFYTLGYPKNVLEHKE